MNKKQKLQVSLTVFGVVYIIFLLLSPGWRASKILGLISIVATVMALYGSYRAEEKKKILTSNENNKRHFSDCLRHPMGACR